jgi:DNA-binding protein Fis
MAGCGCKNKSNEQSQQPVQTQQQQANETVKDSVKKIVEKYYNKK